MVNFYRCKASALLLGCVVAGPLVQAQNLVVGSSLSPALNARAASRSTAVGIGFSQNIDPISVGGIRILSSQYRGRPFLTRSVTGNRVTLTPTAPAGQSTAFKAGETVSVIVPATVTSTSGAAAGPFVYQFTTATTGGTGSFLPAPNVGMSSGPMSTAAADLDNDGDLDLLTASYFNNRVNVRFNNGSAGFTNGADVLVGTSPFCVVTGDLDGDQDLDFVATNVGTNNVSVKLNNQTNPGVAFTSMGTVAVGNNPRTAALADVDADGDLDLLTANAGVNGTVSVRFNNGEGTFTGTTEVVVGSGPYGLALGDVDNDGDMDIVTANHANSISVRLNDGRGSFLGSTDLPLAGQPGSVALGDVDADGDLDVVAACYTGNVVAVFFNNGAGAFLTSASVPVDASPIKVTLGDVDSDGDLDLLAASFAAPGAVSIRLNNGAGTFTGTTLVASGNNGGIVDIVMADIDGNSTLDCLTVNNAAGTVGLLLNMPAPTAADGALANSFIMVYPNPASANAPVLVSLPAPAGQTEASATLLNALGQVVATQRLTGPSDGKLCAELPTAGLPAGVYLVRLLAGPTLVSQRLVLY